MNAWLRKYESIGFGWKGAVASHNQPPHERKRGYSLSQPYKHIIPLIWGYVNPLHDIFFI